MIKDLDFSTFIGKQCNVDKLHYLVFDIESVDYETVPLANIRRPKARRRLSCHSPRRPEAAGGFPSMILGP